MKSENPLQDKMRSVAKKLLLAMLVVIAIISLWTPLAHSAIAERWFSLPNLWFLLPVPLLVALISIWLWRSLGQPNSHTLPFVLTLGLIFLGFSGLGISIWPHIIPPSITLWQAAAPAQSQGFMLVGALLIIPIIWCTPSGATTFSAAKFNMVRGIIDATNNLETPDVAGDPLGRQRAGPRRRWHVLSSPDDGRRI